MPGPRHRLEAAGVTGILGGMRRDTLRIDLALQGGGSHGAFTWGALDRLLEDGSLGFAGISGTSAGALNGAVMVTGLARGGAEGGRQALHDFWHDVAGAGTCFDPVLLQRQRGAATPWDAWTAPIAQAWTQWASAFSAVPTVSSRGKPSVSTGS